MHGLSFDMSVIVVARRVAFIVMRSRFCNDRLKYCIVFLFHFIGSIVLEYLDVKNLTFYFSMKRKIHRDSMERDGDQCPTTCKCLEVLILLHQKFISNSFYY